MIPLPEILMIDPNSLDPNSPSAQVGFIAGFGGASGLYNSLAMNLMRLTKPRLLNLAEGQTITPSSSLVLGTSSNPFAPGGTGYYTVRYKMNSGPWIAVVPDSGGLTFSMLLDLSALQSGPNTISVYGQDGNLNPSLNYLKDPSKVIRTVNFNYAP